MKRCEAHVCVACVNGCCSAALTEEYTERRMDVIRDYGGFYYKGGGEDVSRPNWKQQFMDRFERVR